MQVKRENPDRCISPRGETKREHARTAKDCVIATQVAIYPRINMTISGVKTYDRIAPSLLPVRNLSSIKDLIWDMIDANRITLEGKQRVNREIDAA